MAGINRTTGKATDLITFSRASGGTALRKISYGSELAPSLSTAIKVGDAATTIAYNSGAGSLDIDAATTLDGAILLVSGVIVGRVYLFTADITLGTCTDSRITVGPSYTNQARLQSSGTVSLVFTAEDTQIRIDSYTDTGTFTINSISVKEVLFDQPSGTLTLFNHPTNIPRIEYAADGTVKGLLIEESRTNLVTYSNDFTNASWFSFASVITESYADSPLGANTATRFQDDTTSGTTTAYINASATVATSSDYTFSVYAKADQTNFVALLPASFTTPAGAPTTFNLNTGEVGTVASGVSAAIQSVGNGWYRCSITFTTDVSDTTGFVRINLAEADNDIAFAHDGTHSVLIAGAQFEAGSFPTSYIPTSGATATRAADIASISVDSFGYRQDAGTVVVEFLGADVGSTEIKRILSLSDGTSANRMDLLSVASEEVQLYVVDGGVFQVGKNSLSSSVDGIMSTVAACYKENSFGISLDGSSVVSENTATVPDVTSMRIGSSPVNNYRNGHIKSVTYYPRRLSNAQLQELTA